MGGMCSWGWKSGSPEVGKVGKSGSLEVGKVRKSKGKTNRKICSLTFNLLGIPTFGLPDFSDFRTKLHLPNHFINHLPVAVA
jgi:hypothetical protein